MGTRRLRRKAERFAAEFGGEVSCARCVEAVLDGPRGKPRRRLRGGVTVLELAGATGYSTASIAQTLKRMKRQCLVFQEYGGARWFRDDAAWAPPHRGLWKR